MDTSDLAAENAKLKSQLDRAVNMLKRMSTAPQEAKELNEKLQLAERRATLAESRIRELENELTQVRASQKQAGVLPKASSNSTNLGQQSTGLLPSSPSSSSTSKSSASPSYAHIPGRSAQAELDDLLNSFSISEPLPPSAGGKTGTLSSPRGGGGGGMIPNNQVTSNNNNSNNNPPGFATQSLDDLIAGFGLDNSSSAGKPVSVGQISNASGFGGASNSGDEVVQIAIGKTRGGTGVHVADSEALPSDREVLYDFQNAGRRNPPQPDFHPVNGKIIPYRFITIEQMEADLVYMRDLVKSGQLSNTSYQAQRDVRKVILT